MKKCIRNSDGSCVMSCQANGKLPEDVGKLFYYDLVLENVENNLKYYFGNLFFIML